MGRPITRGIRSWKLAGSAFVALVLAGLAAPGAQAEGKAATPPAGSDAKARVFNEQVLPILKAHCAKCHGPRKAEASLDLTTAAGVLKGSEGGPVVVSGAPEKSILLQKVESGEMPPPEQKDRLSPAQIDLIRAWIGGNALGAKREEVSPAAKPPEVSSKDREFWAFRSPVAAPVPAVKEKALVRTPIDAFLLARLEAKGLTFSPDASKPTLLRRAWLDLVGLPPSPEDARAFLADNRKDAYERLIDRLLDSPQYGERWGRHWLDVAGYTDAPHTDGQGDFLSVDDWRYRDYVVRSLNRDKSYDRFLQEQIAGDELVDWRGASQYTPEMADALIATGYLRTVPDLTHGDQMAAAKYKYDTLARVVENVSTGVLGLTMGCVRCHTHKFDPIPHQDYYRMMAVFATAYNPDDWKRPIDRWLPDRSKADQDDAARRNARLDDLRRDDERRLEELRRSHRQRLFAERLNRVPEALRNKIKTAAETPAQKRDDAQRRLLKKFQPLLNVSLADMRRDYGAAERALDATLEERVASHRTCVRSFARIQALYDVGSAPTIHELMRGSADTPGPAVDAGFVTVLSKPGQTNAVRPADTKGKSSGRRLALARWLTSRDQPLTARVFVNRVWEHHFGKGVVATPENFGHSGTRPTHPELLDWLAADFMDHGWKIKRLHKQIMCSTAYRQASSRPAESAAAAVDPENELLWRMNLRRIEAEVLRDSVLSASGKLDLSMGGPPIPLESNAEGLVTVIPNGPTPTSQWRRSLYLRELRGSHPSGKGFTLSMLEVFDYPEIVINCTRRSCSTTPLQSLALINSGFMMEQARYFAERVGRTAGPDAPAEKQVDAAFRIALARPPRATELAFCVEHLREESQLYAGLKLAPPEAARRALASLCLILFASNEFLYIG